MNTFKLLSMMTLTVVASYAQANNYIDEGSAALILNKNLGFNVKGFNYDQKQFPCDIDKVLIEKIVEKAKNDKLIVKTSGDSKVINKATIPVLAIDIDGLSLGDKGPKYGKNVDTALPSVKATVALIDKNSAEGFVTAKHSCAIATISEVTPAAGSSVLDLGGFGVTVCSATHKCLNDLSSDIIDWVKPQLP